MLTKRKLKNKVRVTFTLPARDGEESICLVGDFNNWEECVTPMARNKDGDWEVKLDLEPNREYQYRYLVNERTWRNDPAADDYVRNPFGSDNSLVSTVVTRLPKRSGSKKAARNEPRPSRRPR